MSVLLGLVIAVYGGSLLVAGSAAFLSAISPGFRRLIVDHRPTGG